MDRGLLYYCSRWFGGFVVTTVLCLGQAQATELTHVASAADEIRVGNLVIDNPFDFYFGAEFGMDIGSGRITREPTADNINGSAGCTERDARDCRPVDELNFQRNIYAMKLYAEIGIFHDLALTFGWKLVLSDKISFDYAKGVSASNSSVSMVDPTTGSPLFNYKHVSKHTGSGPLDIGMKWAPLSDQRDESKPMWVLKFNWSAPFTADTYKPSASNRPTESDPAPVGDGVHRLTFGMALSKRIANFGFIGIDPNIHRRGFVDPYFDVSYTLPIPQEGRADRALVKTSSNIFGNRPSHEARANAGFEIVPVENIRTGYKLAIDLGFRSTYYSQGRNYSELTDPLGALTFSEEYMNVGGIVGLYAYIAHFVKIKAAFGISYNTPHLLTNETVGIDRDGDKQVTDNGSDDLNPYFKNYDQVGFRFRNERHMILSWMISLMMTF